MTSEIKAAQEIFPCVVIIDDVLENPQHYIDLALSQESWTNSTVGQERVEHSGYRTSTTIPLDVVYTAPVEWHYIAQTIWRYGLWYAEKFGIEFSEMETAQLLHYSQGQGFYKSHWDDGAGMHRIFSALLYLNDVEEGGETYFNKFNISIKPKAGRLALFPANYVFEHEARTPTKGEKFVVVTWFNPVP